MMQTCPCRDRCIISDGTGARAIAAIPGYRCGFEIVGTIDCCPKQQRLAPVPLDAAGDNTASPRQLALQF